MSRGFITIAQNGSHGDYLRAAYGLALSLKKTQKKYSGLSVMITPGMEVPDRYRDVFDRVVEIPWGDMARTADWKIHNKWKVYYGTPYTETILLDADMLLGDDISDWWNILARRPVYACTQPYTFRGEPATGLHYRQAFVDSKLPHVYTAFLYYRQCEEAQKYFRVVEQVYKEWDSVRNYYPNLPPLISGDLAFATAMKLSGTSDIYTGANFPGIVHMKSHLQDIGDNLFEDWTQHLDTQVRRDGTIYVGGFRQRYPFHYHVKEFLTDVILERLEHV